MRFVPLCSGSSGNATYIEAGNARLLIDAGLSCRRITELMSQVGADPRALDAILVTHEHIDHIRGISVLSRKYHIPVYANADTWGAMETALAGVYPSERCVFESDKDMYLGRLRIYPFTTPHDAAHSVGFTVFDGENKCGVCTDLGHVDKRIIEILSGCSVLLLEANHDVDMLMAGPYPYALKQRILSGRGHLCNEDCGKAAAALYERGVKHLILGHLSAENNFPPLAVATVRGVLRDSGVPDEGMSIALAQRSEPTGIFEVA